MKSIEEIEPFEKAIGQLNNLIRDFSDLSKKKPDGPVNKFKLGLVNSILEVLNKTLDSSNMPFESFSVFSEDDLPTNSDVLLVLNQYHKCSYDFAEKNVTRYAGDTHWLINRKRSEQTVHIPSLFRG